MANIHPNILSKNKVASWAPEKGPNKEELSGGRVNPGLVGGF